LNADKLTGRWVNTNPETQGLAELVIERDGEQFSVGAVGVGVDGPIDWPMSKARVLANLVKEAGQRAVALYLFLPTSVRTVWRGKNVLDFGGNIGNIF
jgi:hypothetical protein